jgi:hypothetical protein
VDARQGNYYGYSVPWLGDADGDGERELLVANMNGHVLKYTDVDGNQGGKFTLADSNYLHMKWGQFLAMDLADIDGNGDYDFVLGNFRGGLRLSTFGQQVGIDGGPKTSLEFHVFPNPATQQLTVRPGVAATGMVTVYNLTGTVVARETLAASATSVDVSHLPNGIYVVKLSTNKGAGMQKVVIQR